MAGWEQSGQFPGSRCTYLVLAQLKGYAFSHHLFGKYLVLDFLQREHSSLGDGDDVILPFFGLFAE